MEKMQIKRHVSTKIFFLLLGGYILVTIFLSSIYMVNQYAKIKQNAFNNQEMLLKASSASLGQVTYDGDVNQLESLLDGIVKSPIIAGIQFIDKTEVLNIKFGVVPDFNTIIKTTNIEKGSFNKIVQYENDLLFGLVKKVLFNDYEVGIILVSSSKTIIFDELKSAFIIILLSTLVQGILLWIFFKWVSIVYLHRRLNKIVKGLKSLEPLKGKFTPLKVDTKEQDEIWAIQNSFNEMAEKLQKSHDKLKSYNKKLKEEVYKRTIELEKISITDRLTGLYNRHKLDKVLENEFKRAKRFDISFSLILLDMDDFKLVNDSFGHQVGDKVLVELSKLLLKNIRSIDVVGRWGGEEFLIIATQTELQGALVLANLIKKEIEKYKFTQVGTKTASFGVSTYKKGDSINKLISRTDLALYSSKEAGKNQVQAY